MLEINRSVLIVKPKQPYLDWANSLPNPTPVTLEQLRDDCSAYLVREIMDPAEEQTVLKDCYREIFDAALFGWVMDQELWPKKRDLKMFKQWFDVEFHSLVFDLCESDEIGRAK